jgi:nucleoside-diphosphate-sugar epimerase
MELFGLLPLEDLEYVCNLASELISENRYANFVVVGASGFLGRWLSTFLTYLQVNAEFLGTLSLVVRNRQSLAEFKEMHSFGKQKIIEVNSLNSESFNHLNLNRTIVFFAASSTSTARLRKEDGQSSALHLAQCVVRHLPREKISFIHLSSGGIYEPGARLLSGIPKYFKTQQESDNAYIHEKILLENWTSELTLKNQISVLNPRLFSFYGPGLQLDRHFAIGEFLERARRGLPIEVNGNPSNRRSYLHPRDAIWQLLLQCIEGTPVHTQIGSTNVVTIEKVGRIMANLLGVEFRIMDCGNSEVDHYVPLDVPNAIEKDFEQGIRQWNEWLNKRLIS